MIDPPQRSMLLWQKTGNHLISELYGSGSCRGYWLHTYAHAHWNHCTALTEPQLQGVFSVISAWNRSGSPICYEGRIIWTFQNRWEIEKIPFRSRDIGCWLKKTCHSISRNFKRLNPKNERIFFSETLHTTLYLIEILPCKISHRNYKPFTTCKAS